MKVNKVRKKGFTLLELIISLTISVIILVFLLSFIADSLNEISYSNKKSKFLSSFYSFQSKVANSRIEFLSGSILINNSIGNGSDVIMFHDLDEKSGVIFGMVNKDTMSLDKSSNIDIYGEKYLAYRKVSDIEISELKSTPNKVYDYNFYLGNIFENIILKDMQVNIYNNTNSLSIFDMDLYVNMNYKKNLDGVRISELESEYFEKINFNF